MIDVYHENISTMYIQVFIKMRYIFMFYAISKKVNTDIYTETDTDVSLVNIMQDIILMTDYNI